MCTCRENTRHNWHVLIFGFIRFFAIGLCKHSRLTLYLTLVVLVLVICCNIIWVDFFIFNDIPNFKVECPVMDTLKTQGITFMVPVYHQISMKY